MKTDESDIDDFSRHCADLNPVPHPYAVLSSQEEVADHRDDHVLQRQCDARCNKAGEGRDRTQFRHERKDQDQRNSAPEHNLAHEQKLVAPPHVVHIAKDRSSPEFPDEQHSAQRDQQSDEPHQQFLGSLLQLGGNLGFPVG